MVISLATELITKWNSLKEVFRIPKKARRHPLKPNPPVATPPPVSQYNQVTATAPKPVTTPPPPSERRSGKRASRWDSDETPLPKQTHHDHSSQPSAAPRRVDYSNTRQHYHHQQQSVLGPPPPAPLPPLQNTVIVQQSPAGHHSVYVQQHLFTGPLHTTTQYLPPPQPLSTATTQPLLIHQSTMPVPTASTQPLLVHQATMPVSAASTQPLLVHQATMPIPTASTQPLLAVQVSYTGQVDCVCQCC